MKIFNLFKVQKSFGIVAFWKTNSPVMSRHYRNGIHVRDRHIPNWIVPLSGGRDLCISRNLMGSFKDEGEAVKVLQDLINKYGNTNDFRFKIVINPWRSAEFVNDVETVAFIKKANCLWSYVVDYKYC